MVTCPDLYRKRQSKLELEQKMALDEEGQAATEQKKVRICRRANVILRGEAHGEAVQFQKDLRRHQKAKEEYEYLPKQTTFDAHVLRLLKRRFRRTGTCWRLTASRSCCGVSSPSWARSTSRGRCRRHPRVLTPIYMDIASLVLDEQEKRHGRCVLQPKLLHRLKQLVGAGKKRKKVLHKLKKSVPGVMMRDKVEQVCSNHNAQDILEEDPQLFDTAQLQRLFVCLFVCLFERCQPS